MEVLLIAMGFILLQLVILHIWSIIGEIFDQNGLDDWEYEPEEEDDDQLG